MEYAVGAALALCVAVLAARAGFDRDRAFYPTVLVAIASYYCLYAVLSGSGSTLAAEALVSICFAAAAVAGFRKNLWIVVLALIAHGAFDLAHGGLVANPGVPGWWPAFCLTYDWVAAACLAWRLASPSWTASPMFAPEGFRSRIRPHIDAELLAARAAEQSDNPRLAFHHLERAHVLGQASTLEHVRVHWRMLEWAVRHRDWRETFAQAARMGGAAIFTVFGLVPAGNTGGGNVSAFKAMTTPVELAGMIADARPPKIGHRLGATLAGGFLLSLVVCGQALSAASPPLQFATVGGRSVAYRTLGSGQPVIVLMSGLGDGMDSFGQVAFDLAKFSTVIVYDRSGYGRSASPQDVVDAKSAAQELSGVLADSGVKGPYVLIGHSLGGLYAEYFAAVHPEQVAGLMLVDARPADFTRRCEAARISSCAPPALVARMMPRGAQAELRGLAETASQVELASAFRGKPVLVMSRPARAESSPFDALWSQAQIDLALRHGLSSPVTAPAGGHYVHRDQRDWFVTETRRFLTAADLAH